MTHQNGRSSEPFHRPVMLDEVISYLITCRDGVYFDLTCGGGGHLLGLSKHLDAQAELIGLDRDPEAIETARENLKSIKQNFKLINNIFARLDDVISDLGLTQADGFLFDLGVSSHQIDTPDRGFSFMSDGPLDMRMGTGAARTAAEIVNNYSEKELTALFKNYGEEKRAARAARAIANAREKNRLTTTGQLRKILEPVLAGRHLNASLARIFQAIRIEVNDELDQLKTALESAVEHLIPGGRVVVISYHSLEDRLVKRYFAAEAKGCICPPKTPMCVCGRKPSLKVLTRKVVVPSETEATQNPRSTSAKLRAAEKLAM